MRLRTWPVLGLTLVAVLAPAAAASAADLPAPLLNPPRVEAGHGFSVGGEDCPSTGGDFASFEVSVRGPHGRGFGAGGSTSANGAWNVRLRVPVEYPDGTYRVDASCEVGRSSRDYPTVYLSVGTPVPHAVALSARTARPGDTIEVQAVGYGARERVGFRLSSGADLGFATTSKDGTVRARITLPLSLKAGLVHVDVTGLTSGTRASASIRILASDGCPAQVCDPTVPPLANTGLSTAELLITAIVLLLGGATLWTAGVRTAD